MNLKTLTLISKNLYVWLVRIETIAVVSIFSIAYLAPLDAMRLYKELTYGTFMPTKI